VPASAKLGQGVTLPVKVDPNDPAKISIDWQSVESGPARGEVRPVGGAPGFAPPAPAPSAGTASFDSIGKLERLAKLRDAGAITDAEFEREKAKIFGA
jgi:Short C-terminal domain